MRRTLFLSLVCTGAFLCVQPVNITLAQNPGGTPSGQNPSTPSTFPGQTSPNQPSGANGPAGVNTTATPAKVDDKKFVKDAAMGGMAEVELGKLATQKASRDDVKQFGQRMVDDHTKANDQLKQVASKENISIPESLDSKHQSRIDKLSKLSGTDFDKAYIKDQLKDHQTDVKEFSAEAQGGTDPNIKAFASNTLPILQEHLNMVKNLNKSEKNAAKQTQGQ
jgi:putative membrane protein